MSDADKDLRVKITTEADNTGADKVGKSLDNLGTVAAEAGKKTVTAAKDTDAAYDTLADTLQDVAAQTEDSSRTAEDALGNVKQAAQDLQGALADSASAAKGIGQATQQSSQQQIGAIQSIKQSVDVLRSGWLKMTAAITSVQGAIGIVTTAIGWAKSAWEYFNRDTIAAEKRKQEEIQKTADKIAALKEAYNAARAEAKNAEIRLPAENADRRALTAIKDRTAAIREQTLALIDQYEIAAKLQGVEIDRERIKLERRRAKGEITDSDYAQQSADLDLSKNRIERDKQYKQASAGWDAQQKLAQGAVDQYNEKVRELDRLKNDPRKLNKEQLAAVDENMAKSKQILGTIGAELAKEKGYLKQLKEAQSSDFDTSGASYEPAIRAAKKEIESLTKQETSQYRNNQIFAGKKNDFTDFLKENGIAARDKDDKDIGSDAFQKKIETTESELDALDEAAQKAVADLKASGKGIEDLRTVQRAEDKRDVEQGQAQVADAKDAEAAAGMDKAAEGVQQSLQDTADVITSANEAIKSAASNISQMTPWTAQNRDAARKSMAMVQQVGIDPSPKNTKNLQNHLDRWKEHESSDPSPDGKEVVRMLQAAITKAAAEQSAKSGTNKYNSIRDQQHGINSRRADYKGGAVPDQATYQPTATDWSTPDQYRQMPLPSHLAQHSRMPGSPLKRPGAGGVYVDPEQAYQQAKEVLGQAQDVSDKQGGGGNADISGTLQQTSSLLAGLKDANNTDAFTQLAQQIVQQLGPIVSSAQSQKSQITGLKSQVQSIQASVQKLLTSK